MLTLLSTYQVELIEYLRKIINLASYRFPELIAFLLVQNRLKINNY